MIETEGKYAEAENGIVSTAFPEATQAGVEMLRAGGNAVDAACASAFALGVCEPQASGIGGQTMMLIHNGERVVAIDGSSRAPSLSHANAIYRMDRVIGYRAATVPSTPAVLSYVHGRYGRLPWAMVLEPAIEIATNGYAITGLQRRLQKREMDNFHQIETFSGSHYFLKNGKPYKVGDVFKQPDLAILLKVIAEKGVEEFYRGKTAKRIDADMRDNGGLLRYDDLAMIPWPIERRPLKRNFRHFSVQTMPLPGAGRTLLFALMMIDAIGPDLFKRDKNRRAHLLAEVFRKALLDRSDRPFNPNFYPQVSDKEMLDRNYARSCITKIVRSVDKTILPSIVTEDELVGETTHLSAMDRSGMSVSLTQSIERVYGSKAAAQGMGFLYNNYLLDYEYGMPDHPFYLRPNAVPWATVAPTLVFRKKDVWLALGSPGSERIISSIAQFLLNVLDENMGLLDAIIAPRLHCSLGGRLSLEAERFHPELLDFLGEKGYRIDVREPFSFYLGAIHVVSRKPRNAGFEGAAEIRRDGSAAGW